MSTGQDSSQYEPQNLHPPSVEQPRRTPSPTARDSADNSSIPSHNSDVYINSYYYGNVNMSELASGASTSALPSWRASRPASPHSSPLLDSKDKHLIRRLSWGTRSSDSSLHESHTHTHQHSTSSADAGLIRVPLELTYSGSPEVTWHSQSHFPDDSSSAHGHQHASSSSLLLVHNLSPESEIPDSGEEHDRAILTLHDGVKQNFGLHEHQPSLAPDRSTSPDQMEAAHVHLKSSADVYATAGYYNSNGYEQAKSGLNNLRKSIRRLSRRVVHLDSHQHHLLLSDQDEEGSDCSGAVQHNALESLHDSSLPLHEPQLLRGKSLGLWGPESRLRKLLASILYKWWVEPLILLLIAANTIILVVQSSYSVYSRPRGNGYFNYIPDYILLVIFCIFTLEIAARIIVSGFIINPPILEYIPSAFEHGPNDKNSSDVRRTAIARTRKMSSSNTLDTFGLVGDHLKGKAQRIIGREGVSTLNQDNSSHNDADPTNFSAYDSIALDKQPAHRKTHINRTETSMLLSDSTTPSFWTHRKGPFVGAIETQRVHTVHHAFLRHSWNRVDLIAVVSFWIAFGLAISHQEQTPNHHIYVFRALSVLRCARLMTATSGTTTILESLKTAAPILVSVTFFTTFAMLLFGIIGIQSFEGSYRRSCIWVGDLNGQPGNNITLSQICGGYESDLGHKLSHILSNGSPSSSTPKGYICPRGQLCQENDSNPESNTMSFDNIFNSLLQVVIVISSNNWSQTMYDMIDADYYASCLYFIIGIIILNFWLANLFVAVITNSFATLTARTKRSAFANQKIDGLPNKAEDTRNRRRMRKVANSFKRIWGFSKYLWILAIIADVGFQASRATYIPLKEMEQRSQAELYFTISFDFEIAMRFLAFLLDGDWRGFLASKQNRADLALAFITSIIQIPVIKNSEVYPWLTFFQLARFYRVIAAVPRMRVLLVRAFGSVNKMLNMVFFLLLMVGLASLIAVQLFRGDIPQEEDGQWNEMTFKHIFNSFLAMYQIYTSENWTTVLFDTISTEIEFKQAVVAGIFLSGWFLFANFIVLQMFIAVINENFSVAEGEKRQQQLEHYLRRNEARELSRTARLLNKLSPYRFLKARSDSKTGIARSQQGAHDATEAKRAIKIIGGSPVRDSGDAEKGTRPLTIHHVVDTSTATVHRTFKTVRKILRLDQPDEVVPMDSLKARHLRRSIHSGDMLRPQAPQSVVDADSSEHAARQFADERRLARMRSDLGLPVDGETHLPRTYVPHSDSHDRIQQAKFIASHPSYDKSYFLFSNHNKLRRFCQSLVPSSHGERLFGRSVSPYRYKVFRVGVFVAIAGSVISAAIATPAYRRDYYAKYGLIRASWFSILELSLSSLFLAEFFVKTVADGLAFTPNAYVLNVWNSLDLFVLVTLIINIATELAVIGGVSRFTRALKAFRALRLINLSSLMRDTFHAVMIAGAGRILDASILSILYIIPYAVWGQNLFAGLLYSCNDGSDIVATKYQCAGEYLSSPGNFNFLAPRVWANPTEGSVYSFDDFKGSLLILFEIISLEGWINVMTAAMSVAGKDNQLVNDNRQINALFFLVYNLVGSTTVLTLFVSVIIENFQTFSGAAYQTTAQRQWIDLKRLILRQRPSKRPKKKPTHRLRSWCYDRTIRKNGWWSRFMTLLYVLNIIVLMTQRYNDPTWADRLRDILYLVFTLFYVMDTAMQLLGLGWRSYRENPWNLYDLFVVSGTIATTIPLLGGIADRSSTVQFQKIFLTCVAFKLVQKSHALNQLFKTAFASLPAILSLFLLWLTMFLVWAIMLVEVFGLTKWGPNETYSKNFSTLIGSLVFLSMMSTGEGWNSFMHDYTVSPPECTPSANYLNTDCGSQSWAFVLFIGWNVISMYIFLNMFTGTVVENFSYIFDLGGKVKLDRKQTRLFKNAWARFDLQRKGYISKTDIVPFLRSVDGTLEVRMYPSAYSVQSLKQVLRPKLPLLSSNNSDKPKDAFEHLKSTSRPPNHPNNAVGQEQTIELERSDFSDAAEALRSALYDLSTSELRMRRERFNRIYHEALLKVHPHKGVSFTDMLMLLARYKLIDVKEALGVEELIERRATIEQVDHYLGLDRVQGLLKMVYWRRRYLAIRDEKRRGDQVPIIMVHDPPSKSGLRSTVHASEVASSTSEVVSPALMGEAGASQPTLTLSPSQPSIDELETRASPVIESFEATAWGDLLKRLDRHGEEGDDHSSPSDFTVRKPEYR